jgi:nitroreductase
MLKKSKVMFLFFQSHGLPYNTKSCISQQKYLLIPKIVNFEEPEKFKNIMEYTELIRIRESVRNYDPDRPVPDEVISKILDAGRLAPSACNNQPWKFLVISSSEILKKVKGCYKRDWLSNAPHILIIIGLKDKAWIRNYDGYNSLETDIAIAMTHIILAATNEGVGTCWIAAYDPDLMRKALELDENQVIYSITPLGYPQAGYKKSATKNRMSKEELSEFL